MGDQWLSEVRQQIQGLDMELHAALRIFAQRRDPDHVVAFMAALARRDKLMASVLSYLAQNQVFERKIPARHENEAVPPEDDNLAAVETGKVIRFPRR